MGTSIQLLLQQQGFEIKTLKRCDINNPLTKKDLTNPKKYFWSNPEVLENAEAVMHLAGANVGSPWTKTHKQDILNSRVEGTRELVACIKECKNPPKRLVCASAIGIYPDPNNEILTENSLLGTGFLSEVCDAWERESKSAVQVCDVYTIRIGLVLSNRSKLLQASYCQYILSGLVGSTGNSRNYWSWIHIEDLARIFIEASVGNIPAGIYNGVAPNCSFQKDVGLAVEQHPLRISGNHTILRILEKWGNGLNRVWRSLRWLSGGKPLGIRPVIPGFVMQIAWGDRSVLALTNQRVSAQKLLDAKFQFKYPHVETALHHLSNNPSV